MIFHARQECTKCNGTGKVRHKDWQRFDYANEVFKDNEGRSMTNEELVSWFNENGEFSKVPNGVMVCGDCNGSLGVDVWISLPELLKLLKDENK